MVKRACLTVMTHAQVIIFPKHKLFGSLPIWILKQKKDAYLSFLRALSPVHNTSFNHICNQFLTCLVCIYTPLKLWLYWSWNEILCCCSSLLIRYRCLFLSILKIFLFIYIFSFEEIGEGKGLSNNYLQQKLRFRKLKAT